MTNLMSKVKSLTCQSVGRENTNEIAATVNFKLIAVCGCEPKWKNAHFIKYLSETQTCIMNKVLQ